MNKKAYFISGSCFVLGLLLGIVPSLFYIHKIKTDESFRNSKEIASSCLLSIDAYNNESRPIAIYDLLQYLEDLQFEEEAGGNPQWLKNDIDANMAMTEGQLARLYHDSGHTNESAEYVADALKDAEISGILRITNQVALEKWVEKNAIGESITVSNMIPYYLRY